MSRETAGWLNTNTLIGFTAKRGNAWHYREDLQGAEPNHYVGAIPVEDVRRRLFSWLAVERPVFTQSDSGEFVQVPGRKAIARSDNGYVMGLFADSYAIHQYDEWLIGKVATILDDDLSIGSAGLLQGGAVAWVSIEIPDSIVTPEGVEFRPNMLSVTSCNGKYATTLKRVVTNTVCDNTMDEGLGEEGQQIKVKHSRYSNLRIGEARDALAIIHTIADNFMAEVASLSAIKVTNPQFEQFIDLVAPIKDLKPGRGLTLAEAKRDALWRLWTQDDRVAPWSGSGWGVVQAMNTYAHHGALTRGADRAERNMLRAISGGVSDLDRGTVAMLNMVLAA